MIAFVDAPRAAYGVEPICRVLPIAPSTYHAGATKRGDPGKLSARARRDAALQADIRRVWEANVQVYGGRKIWRQLQHEAIAAPRWQVARLMRQVDTSKNRTFSSFWKRDGTACRGWGVDGGDFGGIRR